MLAKKDPIKQNWQKLGPIWTQHQNQDLFDKTWPKLGPKRYFNLYWTSIRPVHTHRSYFFFLNFVILKTDFNIIIYK